MLYLDINLGGNFPNSFSLVDAFKAIIFLDFLSNGEEQLDEYKIGHQFFVVGFL